MPVIESFVRNPVKVIVGVILVALFGGIALYKMPMQLTPDVDIPTITVETRWPGASPQEVEKEIVQEQEEQLQSVEGLQKLTSESMDSMGRIILEFAVDADMNKALLMVSTRLQQVPEYPEDADQPVILSSNTAERWIAWFILNLKPPGDDKINAFAAKHPQLAEPLESARLTSNASLKLLRLQELAVKHPEVNEILPKDQDLTVLRRFCEDFIETRFERVPGVSNSNVVGGREEEMQVVVEPELLAKSGLTIEAVRNALRSQNADVSGGDLWEGKRRIVVRTLGEFRSPAQIEAAILARVDGRPVYVRDVAKVRLGYKKPDGVVRRYGKAVIALNVQRETGANVLDIMKGLKVAVQQLNDGLLATRDLELTQVYDETEYIYSSMDVVTDNVVEGAVLSFIVLLLFLKNIRSTIVIFIAIGTSMIGMFLMMGLMGRSLNLLSLAGISFAVGMLVDNFIVVLENIFRHRQNHDSIISAVVKGTGEVWGAVIASTLANLAVFVPVLFVHDQVGQLFHDLALSISCALGLSLLVSLILIPMAAGQLLQHDADAMSDTHGGRRTWMQRLMTPLDKFGDAFTSLIVGANAVIQNSYALRLGTIIGCLAFSFFFTWLLMPKVEYLPNGNRNLAIGLMLPPPGYNLDQLNAIGSKIEDKLRKYWDADPRIPLAERKTAGIGDLFYVARGRMLFMGLRAEDPLQAGKLLGLIQEATADIPGMFVLAKQASLFESGLGAGRTVDIEIMGPDVTKLVALSLKVMGQVPTTVPGAQFRPIPSADLSAPELHIRPRWDQAADLGITASEMGYAVNALVDGAYAGDYNLDGDRIDLAIVGNEQRAKSAQDVRGLSIHTPEGRTVTLESVADVIASSGPEQINRRERLRAITVQVSPPAEMPIEEAMVQIQEKIVKPIEGDASLKGLYQVNLSGTADKLQSTWLSIRWNIVLAIIITYLVIAALFESWLYPMIIMMSVPLGAVGGFIGLWLLNKGLETFSPGTFQPLDMFTMVGFIILVGTVVNNPILIVEQALQNVRDEGMSPRDAVLDSVRTRIRPIFMTALIGLLGLLPLVISPGAGSELYRGLGSVTLGGLVFSTFFTLFFIPALFTICMEMQTGLSRMIWGRRPAMAVAEPDLPPLDSELPPLEVPKEMQYEVASGHDTKALTSGEGFAASAGYRPPELRYRTEPNGHGHATNGNGHSTSNSDDDAAHGDPTDEPDLADDERAPRR
ncbi:MAG: AcrB/AcrD/AcrF family protein [Pirellula sp.]|nr:AcrB/AcrD/AcrF family protein [Pirellula sp.]